MRELAKESLSTLLERKIALEKKLHPDLPPPTFIISRLSSPPKPPSHSLVPDTFLAFCTRCKCVSTIFALSFQPKILDLELQARYRVDKRNAIRHSCDGRVVIFGVLREGIGLRLPGDTDIKWV